MMEIEEKIKEIEEEIRRTPYNKATQHHIGILKAKLAKLRDELESRQAKKGGTGFSVRKQGDATVIMVGPPSVGKSTLLNALTNAESKVGEYDFTTLNVIPGMLEYKGAQIQLVDIPGIITGAGKGKGRGKEILSVARIGDLILIMGENAKQIDETMKELYNAGIRINKKVPDVKIKKKDSGGISVVYSKESTRKKLDEKTIKQIMSAYGYHNAEVIINDDIDVEGFLDALLANRRKFVKGLVVITKLDKKTKNEIQDIVRYYPSAIFVSAKNGKGINELKEKIFEALELIRVYTKKIGEKPKMDKPMILRKGNTIRDMCKRIHKDFVTKFKYAKVWGDSVKFPGQTVGLDHKLKDNDVVELHIRK